MLGKQEEARELMKEYDDKSLLPALVHLSRHMQTKTAAGAGPSEQVSAGSDYGDDDDDGDAMYYDDGDVRVATNQADEAALLAVAEAELRTFRCCNMLPKRTEDPLKWWKKHASSFPLISELARIALCVPGSQIECERVFSLAGLVTMHLRNRMNLDNMGACVFIQKNLDLDAKVKELLASYYGEAAFSAVAADLLKPCGEDWLASQVLEGEGEGEASRIQWEAVESMLEQYEEAAPTDEEAGD